MFTNGPLYYDYFYMCKHDGSIGLSKLIIIWCTNFLLHFIVGVQDFLKGYTMEYIHLN